MVRGLGGGVVGGEAPQQEAPYPPTRGAGCLTPKPEIGKPEFLAIFYVNKSEIGKPELRAEKRDFFSTKFCKNLNFQETCNLMRKP